MKKGLCCLFAWFFFLCAAPQFVFADAGGTLAADANNVTVTVKKPSDEPEGVCAMRFWLSIMVQSGETAQPEFRFADAIQNSASLDSVHSVQIKKQDNRYIVDIILSEKREQDIFKSGSEAVIGSLLLHPSGESFQAQVAVTGETADDAKPVMQYISASGSQVRTVPFSDVATVICKNAGAGVPVVPSDPNEPSNPNVPVYPGGTLPTYPTVPSDLNVPPQTEQSGNGSGSTPGTDADTSKQPGNTGVQDAKFDPNSAPRLTLVSKHASKQVTFRWTLAKGADGYQIYQYDTAARKYKRLKTIAKADKKTFTKSMQYGMSYKFRVRAFQTEKDGTRTYGKFSPLAKVSTAPNAVKGLSVKKAKAGKAVLSWKRTNRAEGYQVFCSKSKKGTYTRVKTIKNAAAVKYTGISQKKGKTVYYKVRAYVTGADGIRKYGAFSSVASVAAK